MNEILTVVTVFTPLTDIKRLTSFRMAGAVSACSFLNPSCTSTEEGTPGKRDESKLSMRMLISVKSDTLCNKKNVRRR